MRKLTTIYVTLMLTLLFATGASAQGWLEWPGKDNVELDKCWTVRFGQPIINSTISPSSYYIIDMFGNIVKSEVDIFGGGTELVVKPLSDLQPGTEYYLTMPLRMKFKTTGTAQEPIPIRDGTSRAKAVAFGSSLVTPDGYEVEVLKLTSGEDAWQIIANANRYNDPPKDGYKYVLITVRVKNISSSSEPASVSYSDFKLTGSSNVIFTPFERSVVLPDDGELAKLQKQLFHNGETIGTTPFYIPEDETNLVLMWDKEPAPNSVEIENDSSKLL